MRTHLESGARGNRLPCNFDSRIRATRYGCTAPCKEQAGNRELSSALVFYTRRLLSPALILRSIAAPREPKSFRR